MPDKNQPMEALHKDRGDSFNLLFYGTYRALKELK